MPSICCIKGCPNKQTYDGYSVFGFPNDPDLKNVWLEALALNSVKQHHRVCEVHFKPDLIQFVGSRKELHKSAIPTLFCNCNYAKMISLIEAKSASETSKSSASGASTFDHLDHSYFQPSLILNGFSKKREVSTQNLGQITASKKAVKHSPDCNITREPLKSDQIGKPDQIAKSVPDRSTNGTSSNPLRAAPLLPSGPLNSNSSAVSSPPDNGTGRPLYATISLNCVKAAMPLFSDSTYNQFKKIKLKLDRIGVRT